MAASTSSAGRGEVADRHGTPIWYELIGAGADKAKRFYGHVLGWRFSRPPGGMERDYRIAEANGTAIAGLMACPKTMDMPTCWFVYFGVDDVDRATEAAQAAGASIHVPPTDVPGVGRRPFAPKGRCGWANSETIASCNRPDGIGAVMGEIPGGQPGRQIYFSVDDIDAALARLGEAGRRAIQGPDPIPGGAFTLVAEDDRGTRFGLGGPRRA